MKSFAPVCLLLALLQPCAAQLSGIYTINPLFPTAATNFQSLGAATAALHSQPVVAPVTFYIFDDGGPYTENNPVVTFINGGTAVLSIQGHLTSGISAVNTVSFEAAPGEYPVFDATGKPFGVVLHGTQYITVKGIEIRGATSDGVSLYTDSVSTPTGFVGNLMSNAVIGCRIHTIGGCGINVYQNGGATIAFEGTIIRNNFIWRCQMTNGGGNATWRLGYINERRSRNAIIEHNTLYADTGVGANFGVYTTYYAAPVGGPAASFRNNIIVKAVANGALINHMDAGSHPQLQNNNAYEDLSNGQFLRGSSGTAATFAAFQAQFPALDPQGVSGPMNLVDPANGDLHLSAGSVAIDMGAVIPAVFDDIDGDARPQGGGYDAGADEVFAAVPSVTAFGAGCNGSNGVPVLAAPQLPFLGNFTFSLDIGQAPVSSLAYVYVALASAPQGINIGTSCLVYLDLPSLATLVNIGFSPLGPLATSAGGSVSFPIPVPADPGLAGATLYFQAAIADATAIGYALSNALEAIVN